MLSGTRTGIETMTLFDDAMIGAFVCGLVVTAYGSVSVPIAL